MALCDDAIEPVPNYRSGIPEGSRLNANLTGRIFPIGIRRPEIRRLTGIGITTTTSPEYAPNTRFNLIYMQCISDIIGRLTTFRNEKMCFSKLTAAGGETQIIVTRPTDEDHHLNWNERSVQATSSSDSTTAVVGAGFMFGFQTYKEPGDGATLTQQHAKWCCLEAIADDWNIPNEWINNRNMPHGIGTERFRSLSKRQDYATYSIIRRMVKTAR